MSEPLSFRGRLGRDRIAAASLVLLGAVLLLLTTHHGPGLCNDSSRLAAADSLANHGTFVIDHSYFSYTCDKIKVAGHFYSDKPPVQSLYLAGVLAAVQPLTHWTVARDLGSLYFVLALLSSGLSFLLCLLGVYRLSRLAGLEIGWSMLLAASACAATLMLPYSTVISSHAVGAPFVVWLFVLVYGERRRPGHPTAARALGMGLLAGLGAVVEPLSVAFSAPLLIAALSYAESRSRIGWVVLGGLLPLVPHIAITHHLSGSLLLPNIDPAHFQFAGSMHTKKNLSGVGWAHHSLHGFFVYAFHSLVGYRGAALYSPPAALGALCTAALASGVGGSDRDRRLFVAVCVGMLAFFVLTLGFSNNYSGWSYGVRWQATPAPLVAAMTGIFMVRVRVRLRQLVAAGLVTTTAIGAVLAGLGTLDPWTPSTNKEFSFVEVVSDKPVYIQALLRQAAVLAAMKRYAAARHTAEQVLCRSSSVDKAWVLVIGTSMQLGDTARLLDYRTRLESAAPALPPRFREEAVARIDAFLAQHGTASR